MQEWPANASDIYLRERAAFGPDVDDSGVASVEEWDEGAAHATDTVEIYVERPLGDFFPPRVPVIGESGVVDEYLEPTRCLAHKVCGKAEIHGRMYLKYPFEERDAKIGAPRRDEGTRCRFKIASRAGFAASAPASRPMLSSSVTSIGNFVTIAEGLSDLIASTASAPLFSFLLVMITLIPRAARDLAISKPMPLFPPVTSARVCSFHQCGSAARSAPALSPSDGIFKAFFLSPDLRYVAVTAHNICACWQIPYGKERLVVVSPACSGGLTHVAARMPWQTTVQQRTQGLVT